MLRRDFLALPALAAARKRNVLFIAVDDLRPEIGCYGRPFIHSPHIDGLAARGLRFDHAYCQQAVCAPTRASLLTGTRPDTTRVYDLVSPLDRVSPGLVSIPHYFRRHGWHTVSLGKIFHHPTEDPHGWSEPPWLPLGPERNWRGYVDPASIETVRRNDAEMKAAWEKAGSKEPRPPFGRGPAFERADVPDNAYPDGMTADKAVETLRRLKDKPFFLAVGFEKPHLPFAAPNRYWDLYPAARVQLPERTAWPENMPKLAGTDWGELRNYVGIPKSGPPDPELARTLIRGYRACVSFMDAQVGRVLAEIDRCGLRDNTVIVLWGDHGWKLGEYGSWTKFTNFEMDTRVPLILSVPGQANAGAATDALVEFVDIYPTLATVCGLSVPAQCEGDSMAPLLENPKRGWKEAAFSQFPRGAKIMGYSVRTARWRYTEWIERETGAITARELYDQSHGEIVTANLAALPQHARTVSELSALLDGGQGWRKVKP